VCKTVAWRLAVAGPLGSEPWRCWPIALHPIHPGIVVALVVGLGHVGGPLTRGKAWGLVEFHDPVGLVMLEHDKIGVGLLPYLESVVDLQGWPH
jgi:hypothetical protein